MLQNLQRHLLIPPMKWTYAYMGVDTLTSVPVGYVMYLKILMHVAKQTYGHELIIKLYKGRPTHIYGN